MFYNQFIRLCNTIDRAPSDVALEIGLNKATVTNWKKGGEPTDATKQKVADFFHVDLAYFYEDEQIEKPTAQGDGLNDKDARLLTWFRSLPEEKQKAILTAQDAPEGLV